MKKIVFSVLIINFLFADNLNFYTFTLKENYQEIIEGNVIDKDYNNFGDMYGVAINYEKKLNYLTLIINTEYSTGTKTYDGSYQNGISLRAKVNNSYLYNIDGGIAFYPYFFSIGYRFWNRGYSNVSGDYDEQYYWNYLATGFKYNFLINKFTLNLLFQYQYALNPKLKIYLGNNPLIDLGTTDGYMGKVGIGYKINKHSSFGMFYKYDFWHINASDYVNLKLDNKNIPIFEPESYTRNQYLGLFYKLSF